VAWKGPERALFQGYGRAVIDFFMGSLATGEGFHEDNKMVNKMPPNKFSPNDFGCQTSSVRTKDVATQAASPLKPLQNAFLKTSIYFGQE